MTMNRARLEFLPDPPWNQGDFAFPPLKHPLMVHEDVWDGGLSNALNLWKRLGLTLQHLGARGRTNIVKGCRGVNAGWRRSPLGGNRGMQYYLWWAREGVGPAREIERGKDYDGNRIWIRAARHHDDHAPLTIGDLDSYIPLAQPDIAGDDESFAGIPDTDGQIRFVKGEASVRVVHGHPGSGKTTALWKAVEARGDQTVLYVSWSRELVEQAEERLRSFAPLGVEVMAFDFLTLMGEILGRQVERLTYADSRALFDRAIEATRAGPRELGTWANRRDALYAETRAVLLGRALPFVGDSVRMGRLSRLKDAAYRREARSRRLAQSAADSLLRFSRNLENRSLNELERAFPELIAASDAIAALGRDNLPAGFERVKRIVVDEAQDLTLIEVAVVAELCLAIARARRDRRLCWLLVAGDEGQTVRPSGFEWAGLNRLIAERLDARPDEFSLDSVLRSPERIARVIERASRLYREAGLERYVRPGDQRVLPGGDASEARLFYVEAPDAGAALRLLERLDEMPDLAVVTPNADAPEWLTDDLKDAALTPAIVKGLEYQTVCVLEPGPTLRRLRDDIDALGNEPTLEAHLRRTDIDRLRVAISRATENLAFIEVSPDDEARSLSVELLGDATVYSPDDLIEFLASADMQSEDMVRRLLDEARGVADEAPARAWQRVCQAVGLLGDADSLGAVSDVEVRLIALTELLSTAARLLVDGMPARVRRRDVVDKARVSLASPEIAAFGDAFNRLAEWTLDRDAPPFELLDAVLDLDAADADAGWLTRALRPASQTMRESINRCALDANSAGGLAGMVERWLALCGYAGDANAESRRLRLDAAKSLLDTDDVDGANPVLDLLPSEDARDLRLDAAKRLLDADDVDGANPILDRLPDDDARGLRLDAAKRLLDADDVGRANGVLDRLPREDTLALRRNAAGRLLNARDVRRAESLMSRLPRGSAHQLRVGAARTMLANGDVETADAVLSRLPGREARALRVSVAESLLDADNLDAVEKVISAMRPRDARLSAMLEEKSGNLYEAALLYERAGEDEEAARVRELMESPRPKMRERRAARDRRDVPHLKVPCPYCRVEAGVECITSSGKDNLKGHVMRLELLKEEEEMRAEPELRDNLIQQARRSVSCTHKGCGAMMGEECSRMRRVNSHQARIGAAMEAIMTYPRSELPALTPEERLIAPCPVCDADVGESCAGEPNGHPDRVDFIEEFRIGLIREARRIVRCPRCGARTGTACRNTENSHWDRWRNAALAIQS